MKTICLALMLLAPSAWADTKTANYGLTIPAHNSYNWDVKIDTNFVILDSSMAAIAISTGIQAQKISANSLAISTTGASVAQLQSSMTVVWASSTCTLPKVQIGWANGSPTCGQPSNVTGNAATATNVAASGVQAGQLPAGVLLPASGVTAGQYGSATVVPTFLVSSSGTVVIASNTVIAIPGNAVTSAVSNANVASWTPSAAYAAGAGTAATAGWVPIAAYAAGAGTAATAGWTPSAAYAAGAGTAATAGWAPSCAFAAGAGTATTAGWAGIAATAASASTVPASGINAGPLGSSVITSSLAVSVTAIADEVTLHKSGLTFSALFSSVTLQGNAFNAANELVKLDGSATPKLPAVDASALLNLPSTSGGAVLATTQTFTGQNTFRNFVEIASSTVVIDGARSGLTVTGSSTFGGAVVTSSGVQIGGAYGLGLASGLCPSGGVDVSSFGFLSSSVYVASVTLPIQYHWFTIIVVSSNSASAPSALAFSFGDAATNFNVHWFGANYSGTGVGGQGSGNWQPLTNIGAGTSPNWQIGSSILSIISIAMAGNLTIEHFTSEYRNAGGNVETAIGGGIYSGSSRTVYISNSNDFSNGTGLVNNQLMSVGEVHVCTGPF